MNFMKSGRIIAACLMSTTAAHAPLSCRSPPAARIVAEALNRYAYSCCEENYALINQIRLQTAEVSMLQTLSKLN